MKIKRAILLFCSISFLCLISCRSKDTSPVPDIGIIDNALSLKETEVKVNEDYEDVICMDQNKESILVLERNNKNEINAIVTDKSLNEKKVFINLFDDSFEVLTASFMSNGCIAFLTCSNNELYINIYDLTAEIIEKSIFVSNSYDTTNYVKLLSIDSGFYVCVDHTMLLYVSLNDNTINEVDTKGYDIAGLMRDDNDDVFLILNERYTTYLTHVNKSDISDIKEIGEISSGIYASCAGIGNYKSIVVSSDSLYGLKDNEWAKICIFDDNSFHSYEIKDIIMTGENKYLIILNGGNDRNKLILLSEKEISEIKPKEIITLAIMVGKGSIINDNIIRKYNQQNDNYKIKIVNYGETGGLPEDWAKNLRNDIITGKAPDIIKFNKDIPVNSFGSKESILVDLYSLIDKDENLKREDFVEGFLEGFEFNGKLLMIDSGFELETMCIKNKFANGLTGWSYDEFIDFCNSIKDDVMISPMTKTNSRSEVFMKLVNCYSYISDDNATCIFDSPDFIKMLKFINEKKYGLTNAEKDNYSSGIDYASENSFLKNDKAIIDLTNIGGFYSIKQEIQGKMSESSTLIGYPSESNNGTYRVINSGYSIMADSSNIDGAWDFLKYALFSDDANEINDERMIFSGLEKKLAMQLEYEKVIHTVEDPNTGEMINNDVYYTGGENGTLINIEPFSDKEAMVYDNLVREAVKNSFISSKEIESIIKEEIDYYFEGERSAEDTAYIIQNRLSILLSEKS